MSARKLAKGSIGSNLPSFKHKGVLLEENGKRFRIETLGGKEFRLPLNSHTHVSWSSMILDQKVSYAIAFCLHHKCGIDNLPLALVNMLRSNPEEMRKVLEGIGRKKEKIETLNGTSFTLPLDTHGRISWLTLTPDLRISYAIALCLHNNYGIKNLPNRLYQILRSNKLELQQVLEGLGRQAENIQVLNGQRFELPLTRNRRIFYQGMVPEERVRYAIAYCKHHKCGIKELPPGLYRIIRTHPDEKQELLIALERKESIQILCGQEFRLPLSSRGDVSWKSMTPDERVSYAIAFCKHNNCGLSGLKNEFQKLFNSNELEKLRVLKGLDFETERVEILGTQQFILPLDSRQMVSWKLLSPDVRLAYALAYCKEHKCGISKIPVGLYENLTPAQRSKIMRELSKSTESDQLAELANAMEGF